jgi:sortase (surface protein transpeptidase)
MPKSTKNLITKKVTNFLAAFFVVFGFSFATLSAFTDVLPKESGASSNVNSANVTDNGDNARVQLDEPRRVIISKIGVDQSISNPKSTEVKVLDDALLGGAVRYPESGLLGENKNIFLFGHSTGFRTVQNPAFKAFNRLGDLLPNDEIVVMSDSEAHIYRVVSSSLQRADETEIRFSPKRTLTLATCNTFGRKEDRFVVQAEFVRSYKLTEQ